MPCGYLGNSIDFENGGNVVTILFVFGYPSVVVILKNHFKTFILHFKREMRNKHENPIYINIKRSIDVVRRAYVSLNIGIR